MLQTSLQYIFFWKETHPIVHDHMIFTTHVINIIERNDELNTWSKIRFSMIAGSALKYKSYL